MHEAGACRAEVVRVPREVVRVPQEVVRASREPIPTVRDAGEDVALLGEESGELGTETDAMSRLVTYTYGVEDRLAKKDYADAATPDVTYTHDACAACRLIVRTPMVRP